MINTPYNSRNIIKQLRNADLKARKRLKKGKGYITLEKKAARLIEAYMKLVAIRPVCESIKLLDSEIEARQRAEQDYCFWRNTSIIIIVLFGLYIGCTLDKFSLPY